MGEPLADVQTNIEATAPIAKVELLLNGRLADSDDTAPYSFSLPPSQYEEPGQYTLMVRVEDEAGQVGEDSITLQVLPLYPRNQRGGNGLSIIPWSKPVWLFCQLWRLL